MKQKTRSQYIRDFARAARPIFVANGWTWGNEFVGFEKVPSIRAIEKMVHYLVRDIDDPESGCKNRHCGRITVIANDDSMGFELSLNLTPTYIDFF